MGDLHVGADGVGVIGVSGGGPHSLACGAHTPNIVAVAVLAGGGDFAHTAAFVGMAPASAALWRSALEPDGALEQAVRRIGQRMAEGDAATVAARLLAGFPSSAVTFLDENPAARDVMIEDLVEAFAGGGWGWLDDARAFASAWGFELGSVRVPVRLWHGAADEFVPVHQAQRLAGELPDATLNIRSSSGHMDLIADEFDNAIDWLVEHRH
jgi:pimeloyl-ACP methyl ester carboxylesterase